MQDEKSLRSPSFLCQSSCPIPALPFQLEAQDLSRCYVLISAIPGICVGKHNPGLKWRLQWAELIGADMQLAFRVGNRGHSRLPTFQGGEMRQHCNTLRKEGSLCLRPSSSLRSLLSAAGSSGRTPPPSSPSDSSTQLRPRSTGQRVTKC